MKHIALSTDLDYELTKVVSVERRQTRDRRRVWRGGRRDSDWTSRPPGVLIDMEADKTGGALSRWWSFRQS